MFTIKENINKEIIIKNSRFIGYLYKVTNSNEIDLYLNEIKKTHKDANHYCYAYIINNNIKSSDDNEPSGTAGIPILEVLKKNNLNYTLAIVIRYFGGIKLGSNGLIRAYSKTISSLITNDTIVELIKGKEYIISFNYNDSKEINYLLKNELILNKEFDTNIIYNFRTSDLTLINIIENHNKIDILDVKEILLEKK